MERLFYVCALLMAAVGTLTAQECRCTPDQFEGLTYNLAGLTQNDGTLLTITEMGSIAYDYTNGRLAKSVTILYSRGNPVYQQILEFKEENEVRVRYTIDKHTELCTRRYFRGDMERNCVPDSAGAASHYSFGTHDEMMDVKNWTFTKTVLEMGHEFQAIVSVVMTRVSCGPIGEVTIALPVESHDEPSLIQTKSYTNVTVGISHEAVFDIPATCKPPDVINIPHINTIMF